MLSAKPGSAGRSGGIRVVIVLDDIPLRLLLRPPQQRVPACGRRHDTCRKVVRRRDVGMSAPLSPQRVGPHAVAVHRHEAVADAVALVDLRNLAVARVRARRFCRSPEAGSKPVEILRARTDNDPPPGQTRCRGTHTGAPRSPRAAPKRRRTARSPSARHSARRSSRASAAPMWQTGSFRVGAVARKVGEVFRRFRLYRRGRGRPLPHGAALQRRGKEALFRHGIQIAFRNQLRICVFHGDHADAEVFRKAALRGQPRAGRNLARNDVVPDAPVQVDVELPPPRFSNE